MHFEPRLLSSPPVRLPLRQMCVLLQTLSQIFMSNPAAAHGLSAPLAPPASTGGGGSLTSRAGAGGAAGERRGSPRDDRRSA